MRGPSPLAAYSLIRWLINSWRTTRTETSLIFTMTTCVGTFSSGWLIKTRSRNIGKLLEAASMYTGKSFSNIKQKGVTTSLWRLSRTNQLALKGSGQLNRSGEKSLEQHSQTEDSSQSRR